MQDQDILAKISVHEVRVKKDTPTTVIQTVTPGRHSMTHNEFTLHMPDLGSLNGVPIAKVTIELVLQKGGRFSNMGLVPSRVTGDRTAEIPKGRYRCMVQEEPETIEVLSSVETELCIGDVWTDVPQEAGEEPYGIEVPPGCALGLRLTSSRELRIAYITGQHIE